ncbi:hypothetical protein [Acidaminobacter hydrogenoformans]|uniref:Uncharacterized protein n=1 Tax=Acidaminobacter hydrogenoformans DSM 2784 TaxID=1120920 RepID=A0A1G5S1Y6_9FIRM|nr:hypothetical protein [Acidaminobacter hydrogenoformans]SCZ80384.1 hypothetical protein SAMN03080599_02241 [Acidaminobacter hydrogenoformans DSM 2784]
MKIIYIYNPESEVERGALGRLREELGSHIAAEYDFRKVSHIILIRATPVF